MIQRIQTLYLLIIAALMMATLFMPLATVQFDNLLCNFDASGLNTKATPATPSGLIYPAWGLMALSAAIVIIAFITIFLYKKRILQIRLCIYNAFLLIGFYGYFAYLLFQLSASDAYHFGNVHIALSFPLISLIFDYLAIRKIGSDEVLVRSLNRLRK